jgi:hypothetical protein
LFSSFVLTIALDRFVFVYVTSALLFIGIICISLLGRWVSTRLLPHYENNPSAHIKVRIFNFPVFNFRRDSASCRHRLLFLYTFFLNFENSSSAPPHLTHSKNQPAESDQDLSKWVDRSGSFVWGLLGYVLPFIGPILGTYFAPVLARPAAWIGTAANLILYQFVCEIILPVFQLFGAPQISAAVSRIFIFWRAGIRVWLKFLVFRGWRIFFILSEKAYRPFSVSISCSSGVF